jgi:hypothetical protein
MSKSQAVLVDYFSELLPEEFLSGELVIETNDQEFKVGVDKDRALQCLSSHVKTAEEHLVAALFLWKLTLSLSSGRLKIMCLHQGAIHLRKVLEASID